MSIDYTSNVFFGAYIEDEEMDGNETLQKSLEDVENGDEEFTIQTESGKLSFGVRLFGNFMNGNTEKYLVLKDTLQYRGILNIIDISKEDIEEMKALLKELGLEDRKFSWRLVQSVS